MHGNGHQLAAVLIACLGVAVVPATFFKDMPPEGIGRDDPQENPDIPPDLIGGAYRDGTVLIYTDRGHEIRGHIADFKITNSLPAAVDFISDGGQLHSEQFFIVRFNSNSEIREHG